MRLAIPQPGPRSSSSRVARSSGHQEQEVRKLFYKALIDAGVDGIVEVVENILRVLRRKPE